MDSSHAGTEAEVAPDSTRMPWLDDEVAEEAQPLPSRDVEVDEEAPDMPRLDDDVEEEAPSVTEACSDKVALDASAPRAASSATDASSGGEARAGEPAWPGPLGRDDDRVRCTGEASGSRSEPAAPSPPQACTS